MKYTKQLKAGAALPAIAVGSADESIVAEQVTPQFVNEYVIEQVLDIPVKTLRNLRVTGKGPPFCKFNSSVRYELGRAIQWARDRQVNSTSKAA